MRSLEVDPYTSLAVAATVPISSLGLTWRAEAVALGRVLLLAVQAAAPAVLRLALLAIVFTSDNLTTFTAAAVTMLTTALGILLLRWVLGRRKTAGAQSAKLGSVDRSRFLSDVRTGVAQGLPMLGFTLCGAVMFRADVFMLTALSTPEQVGFYAATVAVTESALALSAAFKNRMQATTYTAKPLANVLRELTVMSALVLPVVTVGELIAQPLTVTMFGEAFAPAVPAFRILIFAAVAQVFLDSGQGLLAVLGQRRAMFSTSALGAGITALILWLMVPRFGAVGAAMASLCAYSVVAATSWILATRLLRRE